ncbi:hypothetical protein LCGC14_1550540 [marine sediment metagenome]|uniref:Uncharacterized protein n=1 Tax=marine sediment metagenome TaxID=412755 RepID=A0A0F9IQC2_9ZZZZ
MSGKQPAVELIPTIGKRSPFKAFTTGFDCRGGFRFGRKVTSAREAAKRAFREAKLYHKPVIATGYTLDNERHKVLRVNEKGEITFQHPQFKFKLSPEGGAQ